MQTEKIYTKKNKTHIKIQNVFLELLSQKPFKDITVNDIAEGAEINRSTFYTHFQDKYELLNYILQEIMNEIYEMVDFSFLLMDDQKCAESLKSDIRNILLYINGKKKTLNVQKISRKVLYDRDLIQQVINVFIERVNEPPLSEIELPLKKEYFAVYFINGLFAAIEYWTLLPDSAVSEEAVEQITSIILLSFARRLKTNECRPHI